MRSAPTIAITTLGCKVNQADSDWLAAELHNCGYRVVPAHLPADLQVISTCTVTSVADRKARKLINRVARTGRPVVVVGCAAETAATSLACLPGVAAVIPPSRRMEIAAVIRRLIAVPVAAQTTTSLPTKPWQSRIRPFIKVQDGCDHHCSFCIVPQARGPERSRPIDELITEMRTHVAAGARELVLVGIRLGAYGQDLGLTLADLVRATAACDPARIRLSSIEPWDVTDDLIEALAAHPRWCPHLHLPLQSGSDEILHAMGRGHSLDDFRRLVERIRQRIPGVALGADFMVGFPGEQVQHFRQTCRLINQIGFTRLHVFSYSARPGTPAAAFPEQISPVVKQERSRELLALGQRLEQDFARSFVGSTVKALFETVDRASGMVEGLTEHYLKVVAPGGAELCGELVPITVQSAQGALLSGTRQGVDSDPKNSYDEVAVHGCVRGGSSK